MTSIYLETGGHIELARMETYRMYDEYKRMQILKYKQSGLCIQSSNLFHTNTLVFKSLSL